MQHEGPILESLTRRLAETPEDFLAEPRIGQTGRTHVAAVVGDLLRLLGGSPEQEQLNLFVGAAVSPDRNRLAITLLLCWLLSDDWFRETKPQTNMVLGLLNVRSEERRVGKECRARWSTYDKKKKGTEI